ncbi:MAG: ROK family protein [Myxococcota bacterium]
MKRIGVDLGGTKIEGVALDGSVERARVRVPTPRGDYDGTVRAIVSLVERLGEGTVGIGIPGIVSPATGLVKNANSTWLNGRPFDRDLAAALGRPVRVENDANCLAVSEAADGAGAGARVVFAAILGTGCGGGLVVDGRPLTGRNAIAGEWGHNPLPWPREDEWPGPPCYCGKRGCIETWVSGTGLARDHLAVTGEARRAEELVDTPALERLADRLSRALATVVNVVDPDVIVLGGGLSNVERLYDLLDVGRWAFTDRLDTPIRRAVHGDSSGVRGAAWLWG